MPRRRARPRAEQPPVSAAWDHYHGQGWFPAASNEGRFGTINTKASSCSSRVERPHVSHLRCLPFYTLGTQRSRAGLASGALTALGGNVTRESV
jgi:hypothetical protein